jgi:hypothetical protein
MQVMWGDWNESTPDVVENLAGWNELIKANPPCASTSPWRGVFCNAKQASAYGENVWAFEIVGL